MENNKDFAYCSGVNCKIKNKCERYLPNPSRNETYWWVSPTYSSVIDDCVFLVKRKPLKETDVEWVNTSTYNSRSRLYRTFCADYGNEVVYKLVTTSTVTNSKFIGTTRYAFAKKFFRTFEQMAEYIENRKYTSRTTNRKKSK